MTTATLDLVGLEFVADICNRQRRTTEGWLRPTNGKPPILTPEVIVSGRPLWRRPVIEAWCEAGRPAGRLGDFYPAAPPLPAIVGTDEIADRCQVQPKTVWQWEFRNKLPAADQEVAGVKVWLAERIAEWACGRPTNGDRADG